MLKLKVKEENIVIVNIKKVIDHYKGKSELREFFDVVPMDKILEKVMSVSYYVDYSDTVFDILEESDIDLDRHNVDIDMFFILLESILLDIDNTILSIVDIPDDVYYVSIKTLDDYSIVLEFLR